VVAALVVDGSGTVAANVGASPELVRAAVAMVVPLRDLLDRAAAELGCGTLKSTLVEGSDASFALADVDGETVAIVVGQSDASPGALRADSLWLATQLASEQAS